MNHISQFAPGTTEVPCHWCGNMVGVDGKDDTYNENPFKPGHRLCQNSEVPTYAESLCYDAPLNVPKMHAIYNAIRKGIEFTDDQRQRIKSAIAATAEWDFEHDLLATLGHDDPGVTRAGIHADKLIQLLSGRLGISGTGRLGLTSKNS